VPGLRFMLHLNILLIRFVLHLFIMTIQECRNLLLNPDYVTQNIVPLYQQEEDKYHFAKLNLLHQFFQNGVQQQYEITYLETLCFLLDDVSSTVFSSQSISSLPEKKAAVARLLHYALLPDLEKLLLNLQFYEVIFSFLEEYEVCADLLLLQRQTQAEIMRKATA